MLNFKLLGKENQLWFRSLSEKSKQEITGNLKYYSYFRSHVNREDFSLEKQKNPGSIARKSNKISDKLKLVWRSNNTLLKN
jgi:hypothetical protein